MFLYDYAALQAPSQLLIRSEYWPLWLEHATFIIDWHSTRAFLEAFYPGESEYGSGPKKLILQYDQVHDYTFRQPTNIIRLVRLGLSFTGLQTRFFKDGESNDQDDAGRTITDLIQFGCINHDDRQQETAVVAEVKRKWGRAIQERMVMS
ncbi:hypothetical protein G6011_07131 [Alternaria panax]|uniref:Uncharacterized protein n=1 Tax=Alternaria panax TaxID=48097 RepID=A0AAD4F9H0_9PLEO|nr:hypothetical protein G6011_07131 [Alternaria panax]